MTQQPEFVLSGADWHYMITKLQTEQLLVAVSLTCVYRATVFVFSAFVVVAVVVFRITAYLMMLQFILLSFIGEENLGS